MLRMNMTNAEKDLVALHKKALEIYPGYVCSCCGNPVMKGQDKPMVDIFRPPKGVRMTTKECANTFVICEACQKLPDKDIHKGVLSGFLQRKLAVVAGA